MYHYHFSSSSSPPSIGFWCNFIFCLLAAASLSLSFFFFSFKWADLVLCLKILKSHAIVCATFQRWSMRRFFSFFFFFFWPQPGPPKWDAALFTASTRSCTSRRMLHSQVVITSTRPAAPTKQKKKKKKNSTAHGCSSSVFTSSHRRTCRSRSFKCVQFVTTFHRLMKLNFKSNWNELKESVEPDPGQTSFVVVERWDHRLHVPPKKIHYIFLKDFFFFLNRNLFKFIEIYLPAFFSRI